MSNKVKDTNIKNRTYYFFNNIINIENFDLNNIFRLFLKIKIIIHKFS